MALSTPREPRGRRRKLSKAPNPPEADTATEESLSTSDMHDGDAYHSVSIPPASAQQKEDERLEPRRRSIYSEAAKPPQFALNPGVINQASQPALTDTSTFTAQAIHTTGAFRLTDTQEQFTPVALDNMNPGQAWYQPLGDLTHHLIAETATLLLPKPIVAEEVEALAISLFEDSIWTEPGTMRLHGNAYLYGPFHVSTQMNDHMRTRKLMHWAYVLQCPPDRDAPLPPELSGTDRINDIYSEGIPRYNEREALDALTAFARRLGGQIVIHHQGVCHVLTPDPDSAVNLTVYSPKVIPVEVTQDLLSVVMPALKIAHIDADSHPLPTYFLEAPAEKSSHFGVVACAAAFFPPSLRWETWLGTAVMAYSIEWLYKDPPALERPRIPRGLRLERAQASRTIEQAAVALAVLSQGTIVDEDGFLIGYDTEG
ncbi:MAG: hypothetical protein Q4P66_07305 [Actinomycetaceae bacterium]|nr:hypothetical protein [Actinomycetaceae bacterium]